jgi:peptidylprolyl isomerase
MLFRYQSILPQGVKHMKKQIRILSVFGILAMFSAFTDETAAAKPSPEATPTEQPLDIAKLSESFGHVIGKNLENIGVKFDMVQVIKGLQDAMAGKTSPMTEMECIQAITSVQEKVFKEQCAENLRRADTFLADNKKAAGVIALEEGKVQYRIDQEGKGPVVEAHYAPLIKYTGKYLDGSVFGSSKEAEKISFDEIIPGLKSALVGMKEGEKRTVYIHPDLAYGTNGYLPPNSLLTFDVEIIQANAPVKEEAEAALQTPSDHQEIAEVKKEIR